MRLEPEFLQNLIRERAPRAALAISILDSRKRAGLQALFALTCICRDTVDFAGSRAEAQSAVVRLTRLFEFGVVQRYAADHSIIDAVIDAEPDLGLAWEAWSYLEEDFEVPRAYAIEFIHGLKQDADGYRPQTVEDLLHYTYRTGGVLGLIACHILEVDFSMQQAAVDAASSARLVSLAANVYQDFTLGRNFVPLAWLNFATTQTFAPTWAGEATRRYLRLSAVLENSASIGLSKLPFASRIAVAVSMTLHREARSSWIKKIDRICDALIRHSASALWSWLSTRRRRTDLVSDDFRTRALPERETATALRNQNLVIGRDL